MPDWNKEVREHIANLNLPPQTKEEVIAELSAHLEDINAEPFTGDPTVSMPSANAWRRLARAIQHAKSEEDFMNNRTKRLWIPALATLLGASVSLAVFQYIGVRPSVVWIGKVAVTFYWTWLVTLPGFGAIGAYLSRRAQAPVAARLAASQAPALIMLLVMCLILPWGLAIDGFDFLRAISFGLALATWVAIPGAALLLGAAPFLKDEKLPEGPRF